MKLTITSLLILLAFIGCKKEPSVETITYTINASQGAGSTARLYVGGKITDFTTGAVSQDLVYRTDEYVIIMLSGGKAPLNLQLIQDGGIVASVSGEIESTIRLDNGNITTSYTNSSSGSGGGTGSGSGTNCATVRCSATTQAGSRCSRMTTNCNGRCWQHQ